MKKLMMLVLVLMGYSITAEEIKVWVGKEANLEQFKSDKEANIAVEHFKDDMAKFRLNNKGWGKVFIQVADYDVDKYPYLKVDLPKIDRGSNVQIKVTKDWGKEWVLMKRNHSDGIKFLDLKRTTKWKGSQDFILIVYVEGKKDKGPLVRSISGADSKRKKRK